MSTYLNGFQLINVKDCCIVLGEILMRSLNQLYMILNICCILILNQSNQLLPDFMIQIVNALLDHNNEAV